MALITNTFTLGGTTTALTLTANKDYKTDFSTTVLAPTSYNNLIAINPNDWSAPDTSQGTYNEFAIVVTGAMLTALGTGTAGLDIRSAIDTLLQNTVDKVGGRNYITKLIIDNVALVTTSGTTTTTVVPTTTGTVVGTSTVTTNVVDAPDSLIQFQGSNGGSLSSLTASQCNGLLKLYATLSSDPNISTLSLLQVNDAFLGTAADASKAYRFGGQIADIDMSAPVTGVINGVAKVTLTNGMASLPLDASAINLMGQFENPIPLVVDASALFPNTGYNNGKLAFSIDQLSAIANNNIPFFVLNTDGNTSGHTFMKVTDTALNVSSLTSDSANALNAITNAQILDTNGETSWPYDSNWQPWEISVSDLTTKVNLDFGASQVMAQNGWRVQLAASVDSTILGSFGSITGDELAQAGRAGVDRIVFSNGIVGTATTADPTKVAAGQILIDQSSSWDLAKLNVVNLAGNANVDVVYAVDDSASGGTGFDGLPLQYSQLWFPQNIMLKMGVDRVIGKDGVLDIGLFDAQKLLAKYTMLGNTGDNTDVQVYVDSSWALGSLKASSIGKLYAGGADTLVYVGSGTNADFPDVIDYSYSSSQTKNFIDSMGTAVRLGMNIDFGRYLGYGDPTSYTVKLAISGLALFGAGQNFVNIVNAIGDTPISLGTHSYSFNGPVDMELGISKSGIYYNWIEAKDFEGMSSATMGQIGSFLKTTARANLNGSLVVDAIGNTASDMPTSGLFDLDTFDSESMKALGIQLQGLKNVYLDLRTADLDPYAYGSSVNVAPTDVLKKVASGGFKGVIVDHATINDWNTILSDTISTGPLTLGALAPTLDVVYQLDATDALASNGLSLYASDLNGYTGTWKQNMDTGFLARLNTIDKIVVTGAADGDMSIDLSGFGVTQENFTTKIARVGTSNSDFLMQASNGKYVGISIVGLTDYTKFSAADLVQSPDFV